MVKIVSHSELKTFKRCRRKWWLAYHRGLRPIAAELAGARSLGTTVHSALEVYYGQGGDPLTVLDEHRDTDLAGLDSEDDRVGDVHAQHDLARAMVEGYLEWVAETGVDDGYEVLAAEERVIVPLAEDLYLAGRLDLRVRRVIDDAVLFRDFKTVGDLAQPVRTLHLDEQMLTYQTLLRRRHPDERIDGAEYQMLRKVKRTARAKPPFYARIEQRWPPATLDSFERRLAGEVADVTRLADALDAGGDHRAYAYPNPTRDCSWDCDFFAVCPMFDEASDAEGLLADLFESSDPHAAYAEAVGSEQTPTTEDVTT